MESTGHPQQQAWDVHSVLAGKLCDGCAALCVRRVPKARVVLC